MPAFVIDLDADPLLDDDLISRVVPAGRHPGRLKPLPLTAPVVEISDVPRASRAHLV